MKPLPLLLAWCIVATALPTHESKASAQPLQKVPAKKPPVVAKEKAPPRAPSKARKPVRPPEKAPKPVPREVPKAPPKDEAKQEEQREESERNQEAKDKQDKEKAKLKAKQVLAEVAKKLVKPVKRKAPEITSFEANLLDGGHVHVRAEGDCGKYMLRTAKHRGFDVVIDSKLVKQERNERPTQRNWVVDTYLRDVFAEKDVAEAIELGRTSLKRRVELIQRCRATKRRGKKWGLRRKSVKSTVEFELKLD